MKAPKMRAQVFSMLIVVTLSTCLVSSNPVQLSSKSQKRLQKELKNLLDNSPPGLSVDFEKVYDNISQWLVDIQGPKGSLYEGEHFKLQFKFGPEYPFESPEVTFVGSRIPINPHVFSNGHICFSGLTDDWSPAMTVESICLSIISMLDSCKDKRPPPADDVYVLTCPKNPKDTPWLYHDD